MAKAVRGIRLEASNYKRKIMAEQNKNTRNEERENDRNNRSDGEGTPIYLTSDSTLQSPEEHQHDKTVDPRKDTTRDVSDSDLTEIKAGTLTGRDRTGNDNNP